MYYDLEIYFFRLAMYTDSTEYAGLPHKMRNKIDKEIIWLSSMLNMMQMFRQRDAAETPIVAWKKKLEDGEDKRIFIFSSVTTAGRCLDVPSTKVTAVARKTRPSAGGYVFQYETEYNNTIEKNAATVGSQRRADSKEVLSLFSKLNTKNYE
jgi:hypothetical protein